VAAVTLSGSSAAGHTAQEICARRRVPLQAELGGNNAAIVWADADLEDAAEQIARGAFGFAGQRCTANRRAVVAAAGYDAFLSALLRATRSLVWGDPLRPDTQVGPVISVTKREEVAALIARSTDSTEILFVHPRATGLEEGGLDPTTYHPPTIVACHDPAHEIVQEETFGPLLVVQRAHDWEDALRLANGVRQGLVAALFSGSRNREEDFLNRAEAGILKLNQATHGAGVELPFGGWKASGVGPPEHGRANREFHTRFQSVYTKEGRG
jgi:acyl-CoA reductase-like NAD-dependent aldehyde dehydrogenase